MEILPRSNDMDATQTHWNRNYYLELVPFRQSNYTVQKFHGWTSLDRMACSFTSLQLYVDMLDAYFELWNVCDNWACSQCGLQWVSWPQIPNNCSTSIKGLNYNKQSYFMVGFRHPHDEWIQAGFLGKKTFQKNSYIWSIMLSVVVHLRVKRCIFRGTPENNLVDRG